MGIFIFFWIIIVFWFVNFFRMISRKKYLLITCKYIQVFNVPVDIINGVTCMPMGGW